MEFICQDLVGIAALEKEFGSQEVLRDDHDVGAVAIPDRNHIAQELLRKVDSALLRQTSPSLG